MFFLINAFKELEEATKRLRRFYEVHDKKNFLITKNAMLQIQKQIEDVLNKSSEKKFLQNENQIDKGNIKNETSNNVKNEINNEIKNKDSQGLDNSNKEGNKEKIEDTNKDKKEGQLDKTENESDKELKKADEKIENKDNPINQDKNKSINENKNNRGINEKKGFFSFIKKINNKKEDKK